MKLKKISAQVVGITIAIYLLPIYAHQANFDRPDRRLDRQGHAKQHSPDRIFNKLDSDDDGVVNLAEFLASIGETAEKKFNRKDTDNDSFISLDEFIARDRPSNDGNFDIDRDAIRACVAVELGNELPMKPEPEKRFDALDTKADGFLDLDEVIAERTDRATEKFNELDANNDGGITADELEIALKKKHEIKFIRRTCVEQAKDENDLLGG